MSGTARSKYPLHLPASLKEAAVRLAKNDGVSLNQWITATVAQKIGAVEMADEFLVRRAAQCGENASGLRGEPIARGAGRSHGAYPDLWQPLAGNRPQLLGQSRGSSFTLDYSRHVHRQSHPFERLLPSFSAGIGTEISLYSIESFVYHHAR